MTSESANSITSGCEAAKSGRFQVVFSPPLLADGSWRRLILYDLPKAAEAAKRALGAAYLKRFRSRPERVCVSRGFGFVELAEAEDLQRAIAGLNGQALEGRSLTVHEARPQRTGFSGPRSGGDNDRGRFNRR